MRFEHMPLDTLAGHSVFRIHAHQLGNDGGNDGMAGLVALGVAQADAKRGCKRIIREPQFFAQALVFGGGHCVAGHGRFPLVARFCSRALAGAEHAG